MKKPDKILVIRNDKLGDFMLAWPAFALLKNQFPETEITALVPEYTTPMAEHCQWIDRILIDNRHDSALTDVIELAKNINRNNYDVSISLFSESRTSFALFLARVPVRLGPATKIAQVFLNKTVRQKRSQSIKPEYEYNIDLIRYYINIMGEQPVQLQPPPFLFFDNTEIQVIKNRLFNELKLQGQETLVFIHPGTGGSAINLSLEQYAALAITITRQDNIFPIITAGPGELDRAQELSGLLGDIKHHIHSSTGHIIDFAKFLNCGEIFISGSTGPLHIAAALNIKTVAFYPARQSATSMRWQTINQKDRRLSFSPERYTGEDDMAQIDIERAAQSIIHHFLS